MLDPAADAVATEIQAAFRDGRLPTSDAQALDVWVEAIRRLMRRGELRAAALGVRHLSSSHPSAGIVRLFSEIFDALPPDDALPLQDDPRSAAQIVRRNGADTVLIVFCGFGDAPGMPLPLIHRWLGRLPASLIYLRDFSHLYYLSGVPPLGGSREETLEQLRRSADWLAATRILCVGDSGGVYAALHYGLDLRADAVLGLAGATNLSPSFNAHLRGERSVLRLEKQLPGRAVDLRKLYSETKDPPRVRLVFGENCWDDRMQAEYLEGLPSVTPLPLSGVSGHNVTADLIRRGLFQAMFDWLVVG